MPDPDLRRLATDALVEFGVTPVTVRRAGESYNTVYRVTADDGRSFALRVPPATPVHHPGCDEAEATWLDQLADDGISVNRAVRTREGRASVHLHIDGERQSRSVMLFEWTRGRALGPALDATNVRAMGRLYATIHAAAATHATAEPPPGVLDARRVVSFAIPDRLDDPTGPCAPYGCLFAEARDRAQRATDQMWAVARQRPHLLHGDLTPSNTILHRGELTPIDFQDMVWGIEEQDLAVMIAVLRRTPEHHGLLDDFRDGYAESRPWPDLSGTDIDDLVAARRVNIVAVNAVVQWPNSPANIARHADALRTWLST